MAQHWPATEIATLILEGFDDYRAQFHRITAGAPARFEQAHWQEAQQASAERINLYEEKVAETVERLTRAMAGIDLVDVERWPIAKSAYITLIDPRLDDELAETWFNSIFCGLFSHDNISDGTMFVHTTRAIRTRASTAQAASCARRWRTSSTTTASPWTTTTASATWSAWITCCTPTCRTGCARTRP